MTVQNALEPALEATITERHGNILIWVRRALRGPR
jgi:hypothetical protein